MAYERKEPKYIRIASGLTPRLPSAYQEVEWIGTNGNQYINTGVFASNNIQTEVKIIVSTTGQGFCVFGSNGNYGGATVSAYYQVTAYNGSRYWGKNGNETNGGTYNSVIGTEYEIVFNNANNKLVVNNSVVGDTTGAEGYTGTQLAVANRGDGYKGTFNYSYFKIYDKTNSQYVRDLVPCYRIADSVIGMYDLVNDVFYTNDGSGTFTKGADVNTSYKDIKKVYLGSTQVRPTGWQPGVNTLLYLPLNGDVVDYSTAGRTFTVYGASASGGTPVFDTLAGGKKVADFTASDDKNSNRFAFTSDVTDIPMSGNMTISFWMNWTGTTNGYQNIVTLRETSNYTWLTVLDLSSNGSEFMFHGSTQEKTTFTPTTGTWYNMVCTVDNGNCYIYKDGVQIYSDSYTYGGASAKLCLCGYYYPDNPSYRSETYNGKLSEVIIENVAWTAQEVADYFDLTKGDYGIS